MVGGGGVSGRGWERWWVEAESVEGGLEMWGVGGRTMPIRECNTKRLGSRAGELGRDGPGEYIA